MAEENHYNQAEQGEEQEQEGATEVIDNENQSNNEETSAEDENNDVSQTELEQLREEKDDINNRLLRLQAEFDNFKKRSEKEKEAERKYQAEDLVKELLPVLDNFERALDTEATDEAQSFVDGMKMVYDQMKEALKSQGVEEIEAVGNKFDPNIHHAVMQVEDEEKESEIITEELQKGYYLKDRVIRPAMVKVNQ